MAHSSDDMRRSTSASPHPKRNGSDGLVTVDALASGATTTTTTTTATPGKRPQTLARRACDACRARRRKCIFAGGPPPQAQSAAQALAESHPAVQCRDCLRLGLTCSFLVPTRTRGPKRRKRLPSTPRDSGDEPSTEQSQLAEEQSEWQFTPAPSDQRNNVRPLVVAVVDDSSPYVPSPSHVSADGNHQRMSPGATEHHASPTTGPRFPTDELCSRALLHVIMNDYLDLIYPLVPVIHRPSFRANLAANKDIDDPEFLTLIVALTALTVGLLPSRYPYYQSIAPDVASRFKTRMAMINYCIDLCMRLRTATYWDKVSQRKWAVCYLLSVGCVQTGQTNRSRMLEVEAMQIGRLLGFHNLKNYEGLNMIETQLRKKAFWLLFYCFAHAWHQCGRQERLTFLDHSMLHEVNFEALFPLEVDDEQILENEILERPLSPVTSPSASSNAEAHPKHSFNLTSGFNLHSRVFYRSSQIPLSLGNCDWIHRQSPEARLAKLRQLLQEVRYMLDDAPSPMRQWAPVGSHQAGSHPSHTLDGFPSKPMSDDWDPVDNGGEMGDSNAKALPGQVEIMRANLHGTHLWIQSSLLDQIDVILQETVQRAESLQDRDSAMAALKASWTEREDVCRQMLHLLHSMPYAYLEPNGLYLTYKVRDVGVALLNCPFEAQERPARRAAEYMQDFARALSRLDRSEIVNTSSLRSWVDTDRMKAFPM